MRWNDNIDDGDVNMTTATSPSMSCGAPDDRGFSICSSTLNYY